MCGVKFELSARAELTAEESRLITEYNAEKDLFAQKEMKFPLAGKAIILNLTIGSFMNGQTFECNDIAEMLVAE